jgi:aminoglycoside phosphotransferase family enzyme/predicted kinase
MSSSPIYSFRAEKMPSAIAPNDPLTSARAVSRVPPTLRPLLDPATHGSRTPVTVHETHASWVFVGGDRALKVKKPVALGFLDYSTLELRRRACEEEVRINQALAPGIYLGVRALLKAGEGLELALPGAPGALEYAVEMVRVAEADTLAGMIAMGGLRREHLHAVATRLAAFHDAAPLVSGGDQSSIAQTWHQNLLELAAIAGMLHVDAPVMEHFVYAFFEAHRHGLAERLRKGMVRDGHGDLRCEHVVVRPAVAVIDRIEFDATLRHADIASDLSFLTMDLEFQGQAWAARELLDAYRETSMDPGSEELVCFYAAHHALVRAKVALIAAGQPGHERRTELLEQASGMLALAERLAWRARSPVAVVICGLPATGKSTLATELARRSGLSVVSSDVVRKTSAGLSPGDRGDPQIYGAPSTQRTYELLGEAAARAVREQGGVIVDATCRSRRDRALLFAQLRAAPVKLLAVRCVVPTELALRRAGDRVADDDRVSDADKEVVADLEGSFEPLSELSPECVLALDTRVSLDVQLRELQAAADRVPAPVAEGST